MIGCPTRDWRPFCHWVLPRVLWLYFLKANLALHAQYMQTFSDLRTCWLKLKMSLFGSELYKDYLVSFPPAPSGVSCQLLLGFTYSDKTLWFLWVCQLMLWCKSWVCPMGHGCCGCWASVSPHLQLLWLEEEAVIPLPWIPSLWLISLPSHPSLCTQLRPRGKLGLELSASELSVFRFVFLFTTVRSVHSGVYRRLIVSHFWVTRVSPSIS